MYVAYVLSVGDAVLTATAAIFEIATVMNFAQQSVLASTSGLMLLLVNLQQALESGKRIKIDR